MKNTFLLFITSIILISCKEKNKTSKEPVISALSVIKGQINHLDTSFYQIIKFETQNGITDTSYVKREDIRNLSSDFLSLTDITQTNYPENYTEERLIDEGQNTLSITATAKNENLEIQKQIIIVPLDEFSSGKIESIFIDRSVQIKDSSIQQKLFWQVDKYFQVASIIQIENQPEKVQVLKIQWD